MGNRLRELWSDGKAVFGAWILLSTPAGAEIIAQVGFDYVGIDCQHGLLDYGDMRDILLTVRGIATTPIVRVPTSDPSWVGRALDAGAEGIIVPMVNSREDAEGAVAACRYPPVGLRSHGLARGHQTFGTNPTDINREVLCFAMIETREGLDNAHLICTTPGIDGIYIGPSDLAISLGFSPAAPRPPEHADAVAKILAVCDESGIVPGIHAYGGADARARAAQGFKMVTVTADAAVLAMGSRSELGAARATT
jgi:4-hydroxy-2-oxoheptanedioate aldolase